jgi:hypothetical protein
MHLKKSFDICDKLNVKKLFFFYFFIKKEEMNKLNMENTKLKYRQNILLKTIEDLENSKNGSNGSKETNKI